MKKPFDKGARRHLRFWGPDVRADVDDEMACHIEFLADDLERQGMTREKAHAMAVEQFGDIAGAKRECQKIGEQKMRREKRADWWDAIAQDLRFAVRSLRKTPAFTIVAVLALGLGVGANSAVFSLVDAAAFRPLPIRKPAELQALYSVQGKSDLSEMSYPAIEALRADRGPYTDFAGFTEGPASLNAGSDATVIWSNLVTDNYFSVLQLRPALGRMINPGDLRSPVAVLSHQLWRTQFNSDPYIVGRSIQVNGYPFTVVGVAPQEFLTTRLFSYAPQIWIPAGMHEQVRPGTQGMLTKEDWAPFMVIGRLPSNASKAMARGTLDRVAATLAQRYPTSFKDWKIVTFSNKTQINPWLVKPAQLQTIGIVVLAGIMLVLLIACADVANLLLARMTVRRGEVAVRLALGASRGRLIRQFLTESVLLAALGALAAIPLAVIAVQGSSALTPPTDFATAYQPLLDKRVLLFNAIVALGAGLIFGIAPAIRGSRANLAAAIRDEGRGSVTAGGKLRESLVVLQIAISLVILVAAGLFTRSLKHARAADTGFRTNGAIVFTLDPQLSKGYDNARIELMYAELTQKLRALPGVTAVSRATNTPLDGNNSSTQLFPEGSKAGATEGDWVNYNIVAKDYFKAMGTPIMEGREFEEVDRRREIEPVVINRKLAQMFWPGQSPIGKRMHVQKPDGDLVEVVGLTGTARYNKISEAPTPFVSYAVERSHVARSVVIVRSSASTEEMFAGVRRVMREVDPTMPVTGLATLRKHIDLSYSAHQSGAVGAASFGVLALLLAAAGLYGVISYNVAQRRREIGLRVALGASHADVVKMILRGAGKLAVIGIVVGAVMSIASSSALRGMLFETPPRDPIMIGVVALFLCAIAMTASVIPALRVARMDPGSALRD